MTEPQSCPICGEGHVTSHCEDVPQEYRGHNGLVPMNFRTCSHCGSEFSGAPESLLNKRAMMAFRKRVDDLLPGEKIVAIRQKYKITQAQAAKLFGGGPVAFSKYENDDVAQSSSMDKLLRLVLANESAFWTLAEQSNMKGEFTQSVALPAPSSQPSYRNQSYSFRVDAMPPSAAVYHPKEFRRVGGVGKKEAKQ